MKTEKKGKCEMGEGEVWKEKDKMVGVQQWKDGGRGTRTEKMGRKKL